MDFQFAISEIPELVGEKLLEKVDQIADDMTREVSVATFKKIDEVLEKAGQKSYAGGQPFSQDMYLNMLERVDMSFDESGKPQGQIVAHPNTGKVLAEKFKEWEQDKVLMRRHQDLMQRKREAWLDRESNRKLVD